jgi:chromate transporter
VALRHDPKVAVVLTGVAAAAVGLLLQVTLKIGWKSLIRPKDLVFVVVVFVLVGILHVSLVVTLVTVAPLAIWLNRPGTGKEVA